MAKQNSINNSTADLTIDPGASGDSFVQFDINTTGEFRVGVDDTDDSFRISQGSALGTNDTFIMTAAGECTMPLQPSFMATINAEANVSGDGTVHPIGSVTATTEVFDQNGDFTPGDGAGTGATFTAPVDGVYVFSMTVSFNVDLVTGGDDVIYTIVGVNGGCILPTENKVIGFSGQGGAIAVTLTGISDLDALDAVTFTFNCRGGSKVDDIVEGTLSGYLAT